MNNFSFTDFLYRKAYGKLTNDRGKAEVEAMEKVVGERAPWDYDNSFSMRALTAQGPDSEGAFTVEDKIVDNKIFDNFYQTSYWLSNATILDNLSSNITIPSKSTAAVLTSGGVAETTTATNPLSTEQAYSAAKFTPHHIRVSIEVSATLLEQTSHGVDRLILSDLQNALSEELDRQIFKGDGSDEEISAISGTTGISSSTWAALTSLSGASATEKLIASEKNMGDSKVPIPYSFIINSETRAKLRSIRQQGLSYPILDAQNFILGYPTVTNEGLSDGDCWLTNPTYTVISMWSPKDMIDLIVDGHTKFNSGIVTLTASIMADCKLIHPSALYVLSSI